MKKVFFLILTLGVLTQLMAQDPAKDIKKAARSLGSYNLDPTGMKDKLQEAIQLADASINDPVVKADPTAWLTYGEVFMAATNKDVIENVANNEAPIEEPSAPAKAYKGFSIAAQLADKTYITKDAMKALSDGLQNIYYMGSVLYQTSNFSDAYHTFLSVYDAYALLELNKEVNSFSGDEASNALYYSAICAEKAGLIDEAISVYERLAGNIGMASVVKREYIKGPNGGCYYNNTSGNKVYVDRSYCGESGEMEGSFPYLAIYTLYLEQKKDTAQAERILAIGRASYPDDLGLLFAEINRSLAKGELTSLISKLEKASELEPNNTSVIVTLGQVYDKLYQDSVAINPTAAESHFNKAMLYYQQAVAKEADNFDAIYSIGALWYNKAAAYSVELNNLSSDYTPAGNKKYEAKKAQMDEAFLKAMPFFIQAESLQPNDFNTLVALKEIYARQDKFELVESYKVKIENLGKQ